MNYIKACEEAYLFYKLKRQDIKGKRILEVAEKYFVVDHGLREAIYGKNMEDIGQVLENIVCLELLRRGYSVTVGKIDGEKIGFIGVRNKKPIYLQMFGNWHWIAELILTFQDRHGIPRRWRQLYR